MRVIRIDERHTPEKARNELENTVESLGLIKSRESMSENKTLKCYHSFYDKEGNDAIITIFSKPQIHIDLTEDEIGIEFGRYIGQIVFLEYDDEVIERIDRMLGHLYVKKTTRGLK